MWSEAHEEPQITFDLNRAMLNVYFDCRLDGKHVVFGSVVEGMVVVKQMESYGSQSGATKKRIVIADCGQL